MCINKGMLTCADLGEKALLYRMTIKVIQLNALLELQLRTIPKFSQINISSSDVRNVTKY